jgi:hypothetical protein
MAESLFRLTSARLEIVTSVEPALFCGAVAYTHADIRPVRSVTRCSAYCKASARTERDIAKPGIDAAVRCLSPVAGCLISCMGLAGSSKAKHILRTKRHDAKVNNITELQATE